MRIGAAQPCEERANLMDDARTILVSQISVTRDADDQGKQSHLRGPRLLHRDIILRKACSQESTPDRCKPLACRGFFFSTALLAGIYVAVLAVAALWMPHEWDWQVLRWLSSRVPPTFSSEVGIVDIDTDPANVPAFRRQIAAFLDGLTHSNQRPSAVILDIEFDPCQSSPCGTPMASAREALVSSIRRAATHFPIYATEEAKVDRDDDVVGPLDPRDPEIYGAISAAAQTRFTSVPNANGLFYRICYANVPFDDASGSMEGYANVWAMAARVLMTPRFFAASPPCDPTHIPVRLGARIAASYPFVYRFTNPRTFSSYSQFDDKMYVIVGTLRYDRVPFTDRSGTELLGWALSNALDDGSLVGKEPYYDVQPQNGMLLLLIPVFSGLARARVRRHLSHAQPNAAGQTAQPLPLDLVRDCSGCRSGDFCRL